MRKRYKKRTEEEANYWLSYSDMLAALLLIFALLISLAVLQSKTQNAENEEKLKSQQKTIENQEKEIEEILTEKTSQETELEKEKTKYAELQSEAKDSEDKIKEQEVSPKIMPKKIVLHGTKIFLEDCKKYHMK